MEKSSVKLEMNQTAKEKPQKSAKNARNTIVELTKAALFAAVFCILAPHTVYLPLSPVGITLGSFLVYLTGMLLGARLGCISLFLYFCMGFLGLPVFSGYRAGAAVLFGPTGGFLIGFLLCVAIVGWFAKNSSGGKRGMLRFLLGMLFGTAALYLFGTLWFKFIYAEGTTFAEAVKACVLPFLPLDAVKIIFAMVLYKPLRRLKRYV